MDETIVAISTPYGTGGISIIRMSGKESISIVNGLTLSKKIVDKESHTINYDKIIVNSEVIDEVLISVMRAPKTYTKEDIVEINCHGGIVVTNKILELLLEHGARLATPGEFTKRAFLNGRIDLIEAEGVMDMINAKTENARKLAIKTMNGEVSTLITIIKNKLLSIISNIEVNIDYPEYDDIKVVTIEDMKKEIGQIEKDIQSVIEKSKNGKLIKEGINIAIIGKPNVGKSSILNALLHEDKAIVTEVEGTTRDVVEGTINYGGFCLNFQDTAGIRETNDIVEKIGVDKSMKIIQSADLILYVLNNNEVLTKEEAALLNSIKDKRYIIVINKIDLNEKLRIEDDNIIKISVKDNIGIEEILKKIKDMFKFEQINEEDFTYLTNVNDLSILNEILKRISDIKVGIKNNVPIDMLEIDLKEIYSLFNKILGENYEEEVIDYMFSNFCLGK